VFLLRCRWLRGRRRVLRSSSWRKGGGVAVWVVDAVGKKLKKFRNHQARAQGGTPRRSLIGAILQG
jgi:hypothetical protein